MMFNIGDKLKYNPNEIHHKDVFGKKLLGIGGAFLVIGRASWDKGIIYVKDSYGREHTCIESRFLPADIHPVEQPDEAPIVSPETIDGHYIICVIGEGGQPMPASLPKVYGTHLQALTVARKLADKHPTSAFVVYQATTVARVRTAVQESPIFTR
jgi:hypothetical protein